MADDDVYPGRDGQGNVILQGIVEADETYIGGKAKKDYDRTGDEPKKTGRGTMKNTVLGAVQRGGKVIAQLVENSKVENITAFIKRVVDTDNTEFYTDGYRPYNDVGELIKEHKKINRSQKWEPDGVHTNTMEGFWSFVKRAWYGSHHHYSTGYTPLYLAEACYKYNYRDTNIFEQFVRDSMALT